MVDPSAEAFLPTIIVVQPETGRRRSRSHAKTSEATVATDPQRRFMMATRHELVWIECREKMGG